MSENAERPDDSPVTWRDLREAVNLLAEFTMTASAWTAQSAIETMHGKPVSKDVPEPLREIALRIEAKYRLDRLGDDD